MVHPTTSLPVATSNLMHLTFDLVDLLYLTDESGSRVGGGVG